jgi:hypothetical protein
VAALDRLQGKEDEIVHGETPESVNNARASVAESSMAGAIGVAPRAQLRSEARVYDNDL